jgi:hypothetical protein
LLPNPYRTTILRLGVRSSALIRAVYGSQCGPSCPPLDAAGVRTWQRPLEQPGFEALVGYELAHGIPAMRTAELARLKVDVVPKRVVYGVDDPQMSAADARATAADIGAPPPVAVPGRHLTMISSPRQLAAAVRALAP